MIKQSRRGFLKVATALGLTTLIPSKVAKSAPKNVISPDRMGVLVDTTVCIGCRNCEWACKDAHGIPTGGVETYEDRSVFQTQRRPSENALTVVNEYPGTKTVPTHVKVQCMHCDHPACASACIVGAFSKQESGAVLWNTDMCIGCRYCMVACPFQVPAFEYYDPLKPDVVKCDFCIARTTKGQRPACVEICPVEALTYGHRSELIRLAKDRIRRRPEKYQDHVFGEHEVGGTSWLYIGAKDMTELGFPKLGANPAPGVSESIQHGIFAYFVPPVSLYALLGGIMWIMKNRKDPEKE